MGGQTTFERASIALATIQGLINIIVPIMIFTFFYKREQEIIEYCRNKKLQEISNAIERSRQESTFENTPSNNQNQSIESVIPNPHPSYTYFDKIFTPHKQIEYQHPFQANMTLILFFARRFLISCTLTFFWNEKWAQWLSYFLTTLIVLLWTYSYKPYVRQEKLFIEKFAETSLMAIIMILPLFEYLTHDLARNVFGWIVNGLVIVTNVFLIGYMIVLQIQLIRRQIQTRQYKNKLQNKLDENSSVTTNRESQFEKPQMNDQDAEKPKSARVDLQNINPRYQMIHRDSNPFISHRVKQSHLKVHPEGTEEAFVLSRETQAKEELQITKQHSSRRKQKVLRKSMNQKRKKISELPLDDRFSDNLESSPDFDVQDVKYNTDQHQMSPFEFAQRLFKSLSIINPDIEDKEKCGGDTSKQYHKIITEFQQ